MRSLVQEGWSSYPDRFGLLRQLANLDSIQRDLQRVIIEGYLRSIDRVFLTNTRDRRLDALKQLDLASAQVVAFIAKHETRSAQELPPFLRHLLEERKLADKILFGPMPTQYPISPAHCPLKSNKDYNMYSDENPDDRYINNGDGSVLDICTNFTWEINAPIAHPGSWAGWEALWKHCKGLRLGGCSQWRTQTSREYKTLIAFRAAPSIYEDEDLYDGPKIGRPSASAWRYSDDGIENADKENNALRCVCTEQMPGESSHLYSTTPETITDNFTGLVWQRGVAEGSKNYRNARGYCRTLRLGGHSDWRLPAIRELGGLVTYKTKLPQIDDAFKAPRNADEINGYYFWSSSPTNIPERSWVFKFGNRPRELPRRIVRLAFVRCVR